MNVYGLHSNTYHYYSLEDAMNEAQATGIRAIELSAVQGWTEHILPAMSEQRLEQIQTALSARGLCAPVLSAHSDLTVPQRRAYFLDSLRLAKRMGCQMVVTSCGEAHFGRERIDEGALIDGLCEALDVCEALDLSLSLETHGAYGSGARLAELIERIGRPRLGIAYDTANVARHGHVLAQDDLPLCASYVRHVHLKDKAGAMDSRVFPALGGGWIDFPRIFSLLDRVGYAGAYMLEVEYFEPEKPTLSRVNADVAKSFAYLRGLGRLSK